MMPKQFVTLRITNIPHKIFATTASIEPSDLTAALNKNQVMYAMMADLKMNFIGYLQTMLWQTNDPYPVAVSKAPGHPPAKPPVIMPPIVPETRPP
jgi:hypothetical protein